MSTTPRSPAAPTIQSRKADHIALCASGEVEFREQTTLLHEVQLVHDALPDFHADEVDLSTELLGKRLSAPVVVAAMTGGTDEAAAINRDLKSPAQEASALLNKASCLQQLGETPNHPI